MKTSLQAASVALALTAIAMPARADVDSPGSLIFDFLAQEQTVYSSFADVPGDALFSRALTRQTFFSSDASSFGEGGVLVWAGFGLEGDPEGPRYGMLFVDLDLSRAPSDGDTPMPASAVRAEYLEKRGDEILFDGEPLAGYVWIVDIVFHEDDKGGVEGEFEFIFTDRDLADNGCRVFLKGLFITDPSPGQLRQQYDIAGDYDDEYVGVGCTGGASVTDEDPGCGGEDPEAGGCEGGGCEGDSGGGCEGDAGGGCEGDTGGGAGCEGSAGGTSDCSTHAAALRPRRSGGPLRACMRLLPQISCLLFITWMRRRYRR